MPPKQVLRAVGIEGALAALEALSGEELTKTTTAVVKKVTTQRGVPILRAAAKAAMKKPGSHRDRKGMGQPKRGTKGPIERNITVRNIRKRKGEMVAVSIGPRAWYKHFFVGATRPHVIEARDAGGARATSGEVRTINRLDYGYYARDGEAMVRALKVSDRYYARVNHPGTAENSFVDAEAEAIARAIQTEMTEEFLRKTAAAVRNANARASARRAIKAATSP